jgi:phage terminase small subunit
MAKLTSKQTRFVEEYLVDLNSAAAARRAGYSRRTARSQGHRLLTNADIQLLIQRGATARSKRTEIDADYVLLKTDELLRRCMQEIEPVTADGAPVLDGEGRAIYKFDAGNAARALKLLGDHVSISAFKPMDDAGAPIDNNWVLTIVSSSKDEWLASEAARKAAEKEGR